MWVTKDNDGLINLWAEFPVKTKDGFWQCDGPYWRIPVIKCLETIELYNKFESMSTEGPIEVDIVIKNNIQDTSLDCLTEQKL